MSHFHERFVLRRKLSKGTHDNNCKYKLKCMWLLWRHKSQKLTVVSIKKDMDLTACSNYYIFLHSKFILFFYQVLHNL